MCHRLTSVLRQAREADDERAKGKRGHWAIEPVTRPREVGGLTGDDQDGRQLLLFYVMFCLFWQTSLVSFLLPFCVMFLLFSNMTSIFFSPFHVCGWGSMPTFFVGARRTLENFHHFCRWSRKGDSMLLMWETWLPKRKPTLGDEREIICFWLARIPKLIPLSLFCSPAGGVSQRTRFERSQQGSPYTLRRRRTGSSPVA